MRILFLAPRLPWPLDTGAKIRTYHLLMQMTKLGRVDLACFSFDKDDASYLKEFERLNVNVTLVLREGMGILKKAGSLLFSPLPFSIIKYSSTAMAKTISELVRANRYHAVHFDHLHMTQYRNCVNGLPCLVDEHNVEYRILERCSAVEKYFLKQRIFSSQAEKMKKFESQKIGEFAKCLSVSDEDKRELTKWTDNETSVCVIPNGVDTDYFQSSVVNHQPFAEDALIFTGSMDWFPNDDAAVYFCKEILPFIWRRKNDVKFYIIGKNPSEQIKYLAREDKRIIVTGVVDDVRPFVARAKIFVVPLRIGGGTRLKILEAMAMERAVISTTVGAEGIAYTEGINIVLADSAQVFAQKVLLLLGDDAKVQTMGLEGRKLVVSEYDWNVVGKKLQAVYRELTDART